MYIEELSFLNFRNYESADVRFSPRLNIVYGRNAEGKTNLLEGIYLSCLGRSFRLARNEELLKAGNDSLTIHNTLRLDNGIQRKVVLQYKREEKKEISIDGKRIKSHAAVFGNFPIIILSPDDYRITTGGPSERRRFVDLLLSQFSSSYLSNLQEYHRLLKQRNHLLQMVKEGRRVEEATFEPWTARLIEVGSRIIQSRAQFVHDFGPLVDALYERFSNESNRLTFTMESTVLENGLSVEDNFHVSLRNVSAREKFVGRTLVGPHRDDFLFLVNGTSLRTYGSRGEHKSVLISVKLAEFAFLKEKRKETPVLLMDDFRSELDEYRRAKVFSSFDGLGQVFLTTPVDNITSDENQTMAMLGTPLKLQVQAGKLEVLG